jgi:hypothetical protein
MYKPGVDVASDTSKKQSGPGGAELKIIGINLTKKEGRDLKMLAI